MELKGSYTVEAAIVISFCMIIFGMAIMLCFDMFTTIIEYVSYKPDSFDAVKLYRLREGVSGIVHSFF